MIDKQLVANEIYTMKLPVPSVQSVLAVFAGLSVTVVLALTLERSALKSNDGVATLQLVRLIWVLDALAGILGGYVTAQLAARSPIKHALVVVGLLVPPVAVLGLLSAEPILYALVTSLAFGVFILLGAVGRDWQQRRSRTYTA